MILVLKIIECMVSKNTSFSYDFEDFLTDLVFLGFIKFVMYVFVKLF